MDEALPPHENLPIRIFVMIAQPKAFDLRTR